MTQKKYDAVIIGAGLTGLTLAFYLKKAGLNILVLEKDDRAGGVIQTHNKNGFIYDTGPNSGSMTSEEMAQLFEDLKEFNCEIEFANNQAKQRWIWKNGKWRALPSGLISGLFTPLFSVKDKFRILGEPWRHPGKNPNETVAELVKRRLGTSYLEYAINPFIGGVYAGDPETLVTRFALPKLYNLEQNYGSFIGGSIKLHKEKKINKTQQKHKHHHKVFSAFGGMQSIINALVKAIGQENIALNVSELKIEPAKNNYTVSFNKENRIDTSKVITTCGAYALPNMLPFIAKSDLEPFKTLRYAKVVLGIVAFKNWKGKALTAFGGLNPFKEKRQTLGILFPSSLFAKRAPEKGALLSVFMGGMKKTEMIDKPDSELKQIVLQEINESLQCSYSPDLLEIYRYPFAIPQYELSSEQRFKAIEKIEAEHDGLILAGNMRDGIGMSDRVKQAKQIAVKLVEQLK